MRHVADRIGSEPLAGSRGKVKKQVKIAPDGPAYATVLGPVSRCRWVGARWTRPASAGGAREDRWRSRLARNRARWSCRRTRGADRRRRPGQRGVGRRDPRRAGACGRRPCRPARTSSTRSAGPDPASVDAVLLGLRLPDGDGRDVVRRLRGPARSRRAPAGGHADVVVRRDRATSPVRTPAAMRCCASPSTRTRCVTSLRTLVGPRRLDAPLVDAQALADTGRAARDPEMRPTGRRGLPRGRR